ncbi:hypothetical protein ACQPYA_14240 [Micromonospora sp. CA-263727]|uniref:hypothetical protein n=1 Tax=Micromonospora sp. CA-263727 TaxID=3239967 RepID=UPI003D94EB06
MTRLARIGTLAALLVVGLSGLGALPPATAVTAADSYTVKIDGGSAAFLYTLCLKTSTTVNNYPPGGGDRSCSGKKGSTDGTISLTAEYNPGDTVWMDLEMHTGLTGESVTKDNVEITGARNCTFKGAVHAGKFQCDSAINPINFEPPEIEEYTIDGTNPNEPIVQLLSLMAWCVSAAAVCGLLITGATLASQLRRGALEERTEYTKHIAFVLAACLLATTAGPIVEWLNLTE